MTTKINISVNLVVDGTTVELTLTEAEKLYKQLETLFSKPVVFPTYPLEPQRIPSIPSRWPYEVTCTSAGSIS